MSTDANPLDPQTEYRIVERRPGEPRWLVCKHCDVAARLTPQPSVGLWDLDHAEDCPNAGETPPGAGRE